MNELSQKHCGEMTACMIALDESETEAMMSQLEPEWQLGDDSKSISCRYDFDNYYQTMAFVNVIAQIAHQQDHHPEINVSYNNCLVTYTTHSAGGLSLKDLICAAKINRALQL